MENDNSERSLGATEEDMRDTEERKPQLDAKKDEGCGCDMNKSSEKKESSDSDSRASA